MSFVQRSLIAEFSLANGSFHGGGNSFTASDLRITAKIQNYGGASMGTLELAVYGLPLSVMNQLTTLGTQINLINKNKITLKAGPTGAETTIFQGTIAVAWADAAAMPLVPFRVSAFAGLFEAVKSVKPTSIQGPADVAQVISGLAGQMGYQFENNGVNIKIASPYLPGSARDQVKAIAMHAGIEWGIDRGVLAIWKPGTARSGDVTQISSSTGMVGYPAFNQAGIIVTTLFKPSLKNGAKISVQSDITAACGSWVIYSIDADLASQVPNGPWFAIIGASRIDGAGPA